MTVEVTATTSGGTARTSFDVTSKPATAYARGLAWYEANTGINAGATLTPNTTGMTVTTDGAIVEGVDFTGGNNGYPVTAGALRIWADNVTVRNCRFAGTPRDSGAPGPSIFVQGGATGTLIEHCEFALNPGYRGIQAGSDQANTTVRFCEFRGGMEHFRIGSDVTIEDCYSHGLVRSGSGHCECLMAEGQQWRNVTIRRTWWDSDMSLLTNGATMTGAINMSSRSFSGWTIEGCYLTGSGILLSTGVGPGTNVYRGNVFEDTGCPIFYGPTYPMNLPAGDVWAGNLLAPTMTAVPRPTA